MLSPARIGIVLSQLTTFVHVDHKKEQYATPSQLAADFVYAARGDIEGKTVLDLGAGTGMLALGAALLGGNVTVVDSDENALAILKENEVRIAQQYDITPLTYIHGDVTTLSLPTCDTVIMNPPFGTKHKHIDALFLTTAFKLTNTVWTMHKASTEKFIRNLALEHGFSSVWYKRADFTIGRTHTAHTKPKKKIDVSLFCFSRT